MTNEKDTDLIPIILAGGGGNRLWPLSREHYAKQFLRVNNDLTLLQESLTRLDQEYFAKTSIKLSEPLIICNDEHRFLVAEQVREINKKIYKIVLESAGKNTAPALTCAALLQDKADSILIMMPADHRIVDTKIFHEAVLKATMLASEDYIVTLGIKPDRPETGYGYIHCGNSISDDKAIYEIDVFTEKPDIEAAQNYLKEDNYLWNSGIFIVKTSVWLRAVETCAPQMLSSCRDAVNHASVDLEFTRLEPESFQNCPSDSVDYAVMEKLQTIDVFKGAVVCMDPQWSDIGSWNGFWDVMPKDENGNSTGGDVCMLDTTDSIIMSEHRLVATIGIENLAVIETADAVLVVPRDKSQNVKELVSWLKKNKRNEYKEHRKVYRPWGSYESLDAGAQFQVKRLTIKPGQSISLQLHNHRAEHWTVVQGIAEVVRGDEVFTLSVNESTYIPVGAKHRLSNPGDNMLEVIEVQSGDYLGEDDIVRFEDIYNRN